MKSYGFLFQFKFSKKIFILVTKLIPYLCIFGTFGSVFQILRIQVYRVEISEKTKHTHITIIKQILKNICLCNYIIKTIKYLGHLKQCY